MAKDKITCYNNVLDDNHRQIQWIIKIKVRSGR